MQSTKEATITQIIEEGKTSAGGSSQEFQKLRLFSPASEETLESTHTQPLFYSWRPYSVGEQVVLEQDQDNNWIITDFVRRPALFELTAIFIFLVIAVGKWWGVRSLISLAASFFLIFGMILPLILQGVNPLLATFLGAGIIVPITFYVSHGVKPKTHIAIIGTLIALAISGVFAVIYMERAHLTGYSNEQAGFLSFMTHDKIDIKGLLLAGIIIGLLGTLDDIAVSQASFVQQLKEASPNISVKELFTRGMRVGQDHISSLVNTLVLVYAGAALPLLLLFLSSELSTQYVLNMEIIAEEVVRTLVGSIGVVLTAPITTLIATFVFSQQKKDPAHKKEKIKLDDSTERHGHFH